MKQSNKISTPSRILNISNLFYHIFVHTMFDIESGVVASITPPPYTLRRERPFSLWLVLLIKVRIV